jgi:hypothetical protein
MCISQCLQLKFPDHFPDDPYRLEDIHEAAQYVLHRMTSTIGSTLLLTITTTTKTMTNTLTNSEAIKKEDLAAMFESFIKVFQQKTPKSNTPRQSRPRGMNTRQCVFCGLLHYIHECATAQEYINTGKCKRNDEGKVGNSMGIPLGVRSPTHTCTHRTPDPPTRVWVFNGYHRFTGILKGLRTVILHEKMK